MLDRLDTRILREIIQAQYTSPLKPDFRGSYRAIARTLGVDKDLVRNRVQQLLEHLLPEWHVHVNPNVLSLCEIGVWLEFSRSITEDRIARELSRVDGVFIIGKNFARRMNMVVRCQGSEIPQKIERIRAISNPREFDWAMIPFPPVRISLARTDWEIIEKLQDLPRRSYTSIATGLGLPVRTVKRRLQHMVKENALFALPALRPGQLENAIMGGLLVFCSHEVESEVERNIRAKLDDNLWHVLHTSQLEPENPVIINFNLTLGSVNEANEIVRWVEKQNGVKKAHIDLFEDVITLFGKLPRGRA